MPTKPKTIPFGSAPIASTSAPAAPKTIAFGSAPIAPVAKPTAVPKDPNGLMQFAKSVFSAPATIVARPFQAAADLGDYLGTKIEADKARAAGDTAGESAILEADAARQKLKQENSSGPSGIVAPIPQDA